MSKEKPIARVLSTFLIILLPAPLVSQLSIFSTAYADTTTWAKSYGGTGFEQAFSVHQTSDGGYVAAGVTLSFGAGQQDVWVLKLDSDGNVEWEKSYGGTAGELASSVQQTADGGYIVAGLAVSFGAGEGDFWLLKLDSNGNIEWEKTYGLASTERAMFIQQTLDGGYIVGGHAFLFGKSTDIWLLKLDSNGNIEWEKSYGGTNSDFPHSVQQTADGGYIVAGSTDSFGAAGFSDFWLLKLDSDGNIVWEKRYGETNSEGASSVQQTADGGYIVAGITVSFGAGGDIWLLKLDSDGSVEWEKTYGGTGFEQAFSVHQTSDGGYIVAGSTNSFGAGNTWLLKLDSDGNIEWEKSYGGTKSEEAFSAQQTSDGGYIVAGYTLSFGAGGPDFWLLKLDSDGNIGTCITDLAKETNASVGDTTASIANTTADVQNTTATVENTEAIVDDTNAIVNVQCGPYALDLFENTSDPSDGVADLNQELRAVASTNDSSVDQITFRWISPSAVIAQEVTVPISTPEDSFAPDEPGDWIVEADFGNGQVIQKTLNIRFFVVPESPIGAVAMMLASMAALGGFLYLRSRRQSI